MRSTMKAVGDHYRASRTNLAVAGISYFSFMALVPMAIAIGSVAGIFLTPDQITRAWSEVQASAPASLEALTPTVDSLVQLVTTASTGSFTITTIITTAIAIYAASKVVLGMRTALADTYSVPIHESGLVDRAVSALFALVGLTIIVTALAALTIVPQIMQRLGIGGATFLDDAPAVSAAFALALLYVVVRWLVGAAPGVRTTIRFWTWGAAVATVWIVGASLGFGFYASWSSTVNSAVLVFGTPIALLLWIYLVVTGLMIGAVVQAVEVRTRTSAEAQPPAQ